MTYSRQTRAVNAVRPQVGYPWHANAMDRRKRRRALERSQACDVLAAADGEAGSQALSLGIRLPK
jgi:hypothetical protein